MKSGGLTGDIYRPLSQDQVEKIHQRALDLLEEIVQALGAQVSARIQIGIVIERYKDRVGGRRRGDFHRPRGRTAKRV